MTLRARQMGNCFNDTRQYNLKEAADRKVRECLLEVRESFLFLSLPYCWMILGK